MDSCQSALHLKAEKNQSIECCPLKCNFPFKIKMEISMGSIHIDFWHLIFTQQKNTELRSFYAFMCAAHTNSVKKRDNKENNTQLSSELSNRVLNLQKENIY